VKIKFRIEKAHRQELTRLNIKTSDDVQYRYIVWVIFDDGEQKVFKKPFESFDAAIGRIVEYMAKLKAKKLLSDRAEAAERDKLIKLKEQPSKDAHAKLSVVATYMTVIGTPAGIGLGVYSAIDSSESNKKSRDSDYDDIGTEAGVDVGPYEYYDYDDEEENGHGGMSGDKGGTDGGGGSGGF
jgi:hypothetical protein